MARSFTYGRNALRAAARALWLLCALAWAWPQSAALAQTATAPNQGRVVIVAPLQLIKAQDLDFGRIAAGNAGGTVTVNAGNGACSWTGPIVHAGGCTRANFVGMGSSNSLIALRIQGVTALSGPGTPMTMSNLQISGSPDLALLFSILGIQVHRIATPSGVFDFWVGGTLNVNANQSPGQYSGSFNVRVDYF